MNEMKKLTEAIQELTKAVYTSAETKESRETTTLIVPKTVLEFLTEARK